MLNRRKFIFGAALSAAAASLFAWLPKRKTPGLVPAKSTVDAGPVFPGVEPNPEWITARYEMGFWMTEALTGHMTFHPGPYPPVRGNEIDFNGRLIPIYPYRLKQI